MKKNKHDKSGGTGYGYYYGSGYSKIYSESKKFRKELYLISPDFKTKQANKTIKCPNFIYFLEAYYDNKA